MRTKVLILILILASMYQHFVIVDLHAQIKANEVQASQYHDYITVRLYELDMLEYKIRSIVDIWE